MRMIIALALAMQAWACSTPTPAPAVDEPEAKAPQRQPLDTAGIYRMAIADYLAELEQRPDTLYIGRHGDFPNIVLPDSIATTVLRLVDPTGTEVAQDGKHFAYLNVFGSFVPKRAEFFVVRFNRGMQHYVDGREDRHLYYRFEAANEGFKLDSVRSSLPN